MFKNLRFLFVAILCCSNILHAQNVFSPTDAIVTYNSAAAAGSSTNPNLPAPGVMTKWVRTSRVSWSTTNFKSYMWNGMAFRVRFPNNYNPANASKYPVIVFFHGGGETGKIYDNEIHLYWGAQLFEQRINNGEWNGFLVFPQETSVGWDDTYFSRINGVLDTLQKYNNSDPDRVISMGLSSGGYGAVAFANYYPKRVAASLPASPASIRTLNGTIADYVHIPIWVTNGGLDPNPDPYNVQGFYSDFRNAGGNIYQTYYVNNGHDTWSNMWNQKNASGAFITTTYWNSAHKAQPVVYFQNQQFCSTDVINARMGLTAGYYAYEWQQNGTTIVGATGNEYTATQAGQYRARFMRDAGGTWSAWSPSPVVISTKTCAVDTLYAEHFTNDNYFVSAGGYTIGNFPCQGGIMTSGTDLFTQDATGVQGNRFLINYTTAGTGCKFAVGDRVWNTYSPVTVLPNTSYEYSFYMGNQNATSPAQLAPTINGVALTTGYAQPTGTGNASWKKYTYTWNSGGFTYADLGIINRSAVTTGNDFTIDEIVLKIAPPAINVCATNKLPVNAATLMASSTTATLAWKAATNASSYDVYLWTGATAPSTPVTNRDDTSYYVTGLTPGTLYNWYVAPRNVIGAATGCISNKTSFTTAASGIGGLKGDYYNTMDLSGNIILSRTDTSVNFSWNGDIPAVGIGNNNFSVRWTGQVLPQYSENYTFITLSDDGVRLWVNGQLLINNWTDHAETYNSATIALAAGVKYDIKMEYYQGGGGTAAYLYWSSASTPQAIIPKSQLFLPVPLPLPSCTINSTPVAGAVIFTSNIATLKWKPASNASSYDVYIWTGATVPATATATVTDSFYNATGLAAATLYNWYVVPKNATGLAAGCSSNKTSFTTATAGVGLKGDYYNGIDLAGNIITSRTDTTVAFDWSNISPATGVNGVFSVRWTGQVLAQYSDTYTFSTYSDQGVRLWINGQQIINN